MKWQITYTLDGKKWVFRPMKQSDIARRVRMLMRKRKSGTPTEITILPAP